MPSRPAVAVILAFWLATLAFAFERDVWPLLSASGPPPIAVDLEDEARSSGKAVGIPWKLLRGDRRIGRVTTKMAHVDTDDTFRFTTRYSQVQLDFGTVRFDIPEMTTTVRVTRSGELREQGMDGRLAVLVGKDGRFVPLAEAEAKVEGRVENGLLFGRCDLKVPVLGNIKQDLEPVPIPSGHALHPLQPVSRLANVRPGRRWVVREVNPLEEAFAALIKDKLGTLADKVPQHTREPLIAEVLPTQETMRWQDADAACWVIEYRAGGDVRARTWVRASDGKVLRQEAFLMGERLAIERSE